MNEDLIIKTVCRSFEITWSELLSSSAAYRFAIPRQTIMYLLYADPGWTFERIGDLLGGRDHSTVIHGVRAIENMLSTRTGEYIAVRRAILAVHVANMTA